MTTKAPDTKKAEEEVVEDKVEEQTEDKFYKKGEPKEAEEKDEEEAEEEEPKEEKEDKSDEEKKPTDKEKEEKEELSKEALKLSKDSKISEEKLDEIVQFAKEQGLSIKQAQAHLDGVEKVYAEIQQESKQILDDAVNEWTEKSKKDKEFGGEKFKETVTRCNSLLSKFFSEEFVKTLADTGYSNHPELIRGFNRVAMTMDSDELVIASSQTTKAEVSIEDKMYDKTPREKNN